MSRRTEMLGSTIQRELAEYIMRELNDPRLPTIVSITRVKVTDDLEYADVYVSIMGTEGQQSAGLNALKHSAGLMRTRLTKSLSLRQSPFIRFHMDEQLKKELDVLSVLDQLRREREEKEAAEEAARNPAEQGDAGSAESASEEAVSGEPKQGQATRADDAQDDSGQPKSDQGEAGKAD